MTKEELSQPQTLRRNFVATAQRAMQSYDASGHAASNQFCGVTKLIVHGKGALRGVNDEATQ